MTWPLRGGIAFFTLSAVSCSLSSYRPNGIALKIEVRPGDESRPRVLAKGRGPDISAITCFAVFATGTGRSVTSAEVATRSPSCLGMQGEFLKTFSYKQLTGQPNEQGNKEIALVPLPPGVFSLSIVALHNAPSCGGSLSANYQNGTVTETYTVTGPTIVDTTTDDTEAILVSTYSPGTALNRTASCPTNTFDCAGAPLCDTFTASNDTPLLDHTMDSGQSWTLPGGSPTIQDNKLRLDLSLGSQFAAHALLSAEPTVEMVLKASEGDAANVGLVIRHDGSDSYVFGYLNRDEIMSSCALRIDDYSSGGSSGLATTTLNYPEDCPTGSYDLMTFTDTTGVFRLTYRGKEVSVPYVGALFGSRVGFAWVMAAGVSVPPSIDAFRALPTARFSAASLADELRVSATGILRPRYRERRLSSAP